MDDYIRSILLTQLPIVWSWGACDFSAIPNGCVFHVQGFKHKGFVAVIYNEADDAFDISLLDEFKETLKTIPCIYLDQLVDVIDESVEYTGKDYKQKIEAEYFLE